MKYITKAHSQPASQPASQLKIDIEALVNRLPTHKSPAAERFYRLQLQRTGQEIAILNPRSQELSRDDQLQIRGIREATGWSYWVIAHKSQGKYTARQAQLACEGPVTPRKVHSRRRTLISTPERQRLRRFLDQDPHHRELPWPDLRYLVPGFESYGD